MIVVDPGHVYKPQILDADLHNFYDDFEIIFVKREGPGYPGNVGAHPGTVIQDVQRCCIDRLKYVDKQIPHWVNTVCITLLRMVIWLLETRAADRHGRPFTRTTDNIEDEPTGRNGHLLSWQEPK